MLNNKCIDSSIIYMPLEVHITKCYRIPKYIAIHFTAGSNSKPGKAISIYKTFTTRKASADFAVDDDNIVQFNPDINNYYCWAVGDNKKISKKGGTFYSKATNKNTISIELCSTCTPSTSMAVNTPNHSGWSFTDKVLDNAVKLIKILMKTYNISIENVIRHYDITGKLCPGILGWNDEGINNITTDTFTGEMNNSQKWLEFKRRLN